MAPRRAGHQDLLGPGLDPGRWSPSTAKLETRLPSGPPGRVSSRGSPAGSSRSRDGTRSRSVARPRARPRPGRSPGRASRRPACWGRSRPCRRVPPRRPGRAPGPRPARLAFRTGAGGRRARPDKAGAARGSPGPRGRPGRSRGPGPRVFALTGSPALPTSAGPELPGGRRGHREEDGPGANSRSLIVDSPRGRLSPRVTRSHGLGLRPGPAVFAGAGPRRVRDRVREGPREGEGKKKNHQEIRLGEGRRTVKGG